jgi:hypothetical protein
LLLFDTHVGRLLVICDVLSPKSTDRPDYENNNTNSSKLAGKPVYTLIGTYELHSFGLQELMEVGTIIGDKVYYVQYIADASQYSNYLPTVQHIIGSDSQGNGSSQTPTVRGPNRTWATITAPPGSKINNFTIIPEPSTPSLNPMGLDNTTWSLLNESSGQMRTIKFHSQDQYYTNGDFSYGLMRHTFKEIISGKTLKGSWESGDVQGLRMCYKHEICVHWKPISTGTNHQEFQDSNGNTILLNQLLTLP